MAVLIVSQTIGRRLPGISLHVARKGLNDRRRKRGETPLPVYDLDSLLTCRACSVSGRIMFFSREIVSSYLVISCNREEGK